jgi:hypothetical protein
MDYRRKFVVEPGTSVRLGKIDPGLTDRKTKENAAAEFTSNL